MIIHHHHRLRRFVNSLLVFILYFVQYSSCSMNLRGFEDTLEGSDYDIDIEPRIINGQDTSDGRYPYYVYVGHSTICGGVLIAPDIVLTAGSCANALAPVARVGIENLGRDGRYNADTISIERSIRHPNYSSFPPIQNDIAILKLRQPSIFPYAKIYNGRPPDDTTSTTALLPSTGQELTVIGMGDIDLDGTNPYHLQETQVDYINNTQCEKIYDDSLLSLFGSNNNNNDENSDNDNNNNGIILDEHICAHRSGTDACYGDSGSPLIIKGLNDASEDDIILGLVSWGDGCATEFPGVYTRLSYFYDWIVRVACTISDVDDFTSDSQENNWPFGNCSHIIDTESPSSTPTTYPTYDSNSIYNTTLIDWTPRANNIILERCEGDCDSDDDCKADLICWDWPSELYNDMQGEGEGEGEVPGCLGGRERGNADYCVVANDIPPTLSPRPTSFPTISHQPTISSQPSTSQRPSVDTSDHGSYIHCIGILCSPLTISTTGISNSGDDNP